MFPVAAPDASARSGRFAARDEAPAGRLRFLYKVVIAGSRGGPIVHSPPVRQCLILTTVAALALVLAAPALATSATTSRVAASETFELGDGRGRAIVGSRGAVLGNLAGRIRVVDRAGGGAPQGWVQGCATRTGSLAGRLTCRGSHVRFFVYGGTWRIWLNGRRINVSGRIRGKLGLDRSERGSGWFTIGAGPRRAWPATLTYFAVRS